MAKLSALIGGLEIVKKYCHDDSYQTAAEHDQIFLYPIDGLLAEDAAKLRELGWMQEDVEETDPPDLDEGWFIFT